MIEQKVPSYLHLSESHMETCPRCKSAEHVRAKEIVLGKASPGVLFNGEERAGYKRLDQLAVDECKPALLRDYPLEQFVTGLYCDHCGLGFVSVEIALNVLPGSSR